MRNDLTATGSGSPSRAALHHPDAVARVVGEEQGAVELGGPRARRRGEHQAREIDELPAAQVSSGTTLARVLVGCK